MAFIDGAHCSHCVPVIVVSNIGVGERDAVQMAGLVLDGVKHLESCWRCIHPCRCSITFLTLGGPDVSHSLQETPASDLFLYA